MATSIPRAPAETKLPEPSFERMRPAAPSIPAAQPVARGPNFASQIYSEAKEKGSAESGGPGRAPGRELAEQDRHGGVRDWRGTVAELLDALFGAQPGRSRWVTR